MSELVIKNLHVDVDGKKILKGIDLTIRSKEVHALMGPNGNGKSTLLAAIMGNPKFNISEGSITLDGKNLLEMSVDERSRAGLFLAMQYPQEIPGVTNSDFLRAAMNARTEKPVSLFTFFKEMEKNIKGLDMKEDLAHRFLNEGFSGGEKKRNEILQMKMLKPSFAMLDEIDSGLDVDALKIVGDALKDMEASSDLGMIVVSHYERFYQLIDITHAHVLVDGVIATSGGKELVERIDSEGYDWVEKECGLTIKKEEEKEVELLGSCAQNL